MILSTPYVPDARVQKEAISLIQSGYHVILICWDRKAELNTREHVDGLEIIRIRVRSDYSSGTKQIMKIPLFWYQVLKLLASIKPDIVHCHDLDTAIVGYLHSVKGNSTPWIYDAHECYPEQVSRQVNPMIKLGLSVLDKFLSGRAFKIITVSKVLADYFRSFNPEVYLVGNYQDTSANHRIPIIARGDFGYAGEDYIVGYIGGFTLARAIIPLIEASEYVPECKIVIAGDGPLRSQLEKLLPSHPNVNYIGWVAQDVAIDLFYICDVIYYGLYSDSGNSKFSSPNSLFNAMSARKPVISTRIGEISQIIQRENCGILVDQPVPNLIADAIRELKDSSLRNQMGENGLNAVRRQYNWKSAQEILESIYIDLLGE